MAGMRSAIKTMQGLIAATLILALSPGLALAYVGPGAGISMLGALWGLIVGVVMALGVILFWPIRMMIRKMKANKANADGTPPEQATNDEEKAADNSPAS
jgi:hypothetical protein